MTWSKSRPLIRPLEHPNPTPITRTVGDTVQTNYDGSLSLLPINQGRIFHIEEQGRFIQVLCLEFWAWPVLLLSCFFGISLISVKCSQILLITGIPLDAAIAQLVFFIVTLIILSAQGMKVKLKSTYHSGHAIILLPICCVDSMITGARAGDQNYEDIQSCKLVDSNAWEVLDYAKATAVTFLVGLTTVGVVVVRRLINRRLLVLPEIPAAVPELQAIPAAVQGSLLIIPVVEGDDIDDVLANIGRPRISQSPLCWLSNIME